MLLLEKIGSGKYSDIFLVKNGEIRFAMKISYYREETVKDFMQKIKEGRTEDAKRAKNSDAISIAARFAKITLKMKKTCTPHFIHVYESKDIKNFIEKIPILTSRYSELSPFQKKYNHVTFMEEFETDMTTFLTKKTYDDVFLRKLIFRIIYSIAAAQRYITGWRHNDLSTNNVLTKKTQKTSLKYVVDGTCFYVSCDRSVVIIDYDFVHADDPRLDNSRVRSGQFKVLPDKNASYDAHFFLKSVSKCLSKSAQQTVLTKKFLQDLNLKQNDRHDEEIPSLAPCEILKHSYFDSLKKAVPIEATYAF
ncbi:serine/threonine-protein kinase [Paramecium bursaria Chlorella virus NE-JV-1]|nr:serine/threonine-protein kinase [Paramecium bursaria Chlorella virus NE-JV-1]